MESFSRTHRGRRVRLGMIDTCLMRSAVEAAARPVGGDALFEGLRLEQRADGSQLSVLLGLPNALATHAVRAPRRLYLENTPGGSGEALRVDAADGSTLLLQFTTGSPGDGGRR